MSIPKPDPRSRAIKYVELAVPRLRAGTRSIIIACIAGAINPNPRPSRIDAMGSVKFVSSRVKRAPAQIIVVMPPTSVSLCLP